MMVMTMITKLLLPKKQYEHNIKQRADMTSIKNKSLTIMIKRDSTSIRKKLHVQSKSIRTDSLMIEKISCAIDIKK